MNNKLRLRTNLAVILLICLGFALNALVTHRTYSKVIEGDIRNISQLTSANIFSTISNEITKPIFVSLTMANDTFVVNWLKREEEASSEEIINYLEAMRKKYGYDSVFSDLRELKFLLSPYWD